MRIAWSVVGESDCMAAVLGARDERKAAATRKRWRRKRPTGTRGCCGGGRRRRRCLAPEDTITPGWGARAVVLIPTELKFVGWDEVQQRLLVAVEGVAGGARE